MSSTPFMQFYVGDFIGKTLQLSTEEVGAYMLLLMAMWQGKGSLPNDALKLARMARVSTTRWPRIWVSIGGFFVDDGAKITQQRLTEELAKANQTAEIRRAIGSRGGTAKSLNDKARRLAKAIAEPYQGQKPYSEEEKAEAKASVKKPKPKTRLPRDWVPSERNLADAQSQNLSPQEINREADKFRDHHVANGTVFADWDAGWRKWLGNVRTFSPRPPPRADATLDAIALAAASPRTPRPDCI